MFPGVRRSSYLHCLFGAYFGSEHLRYFLGKENSPLSSSYSDYFLLTFPIWEWGVQMKFDSVAASFYTKYKFKVLYIGRNGKFIIKGIPKIL